MTCRDSTYLDWAATAPPAAPVADDFRLGNPSSAHACGQRQRGALDDAAAAIGAACGWPAEEVVATGGATEADHLVLYSPLAYLRDSRAAFRRGIVHSAVEHAAVAEPAQQLARMGFPVRVAPVGADGLLDLDRFAACLDDATRLVAVVAVNNETGAIQPLAAAAEIVRGHARGIGRRVHFHTDAVQALCRGLEVPVTAADSAAASAHKLGGPVGVGALWLRAGAALELLPRGGGQQAGRRPGTENVAGLRAFARQATALASAAADHRRHAAHLCERLLAGAMRLRLEVVPRERAARPECYSPYIVCLSAPGVPAEVLVRVLSDEGVYISRGSACSASGHKTSPVLQAMGVPAPVAVGAFRVSTGWSTTEADVDRLLDTLARALPALRAVA
ncbi:MAG: aminotransferase class V-fold PLP-dependent enzyme [Spirochaetaceae bacterium]|nr:aminotransferase class V-fold PLP-dependent enzyme [Spirochaetaceae bacterium]